LDNGGEFTMTLKFYPAILFIILVILIFISIVSADDSNQSLTVNLQPYVPPIPYEIVPLIIFNEPILSPNVDNAYEPVIDTPSYVEIPPPHVEIAGPPQYNLPPVVAELNKETKKPTTVTTTISTPLPGCTASGNTPHKCEITPTSTIIATTHPTTVTTTVRTPLPGCTASGNNPHKCDITPTSTIFETTKPTTVITTTKPTTVATTTKPTTVATTTKPTTVTTTTKPTTVATTTKPTTVTTTTKPTTVTTTVNPTSTETIEVTGTETTHETTHPTTVVTTFKPTSTETIEVTGTETTHETTHPTTVSTTVKPTSTGTIPVEPTNPNETSIPKPTGNVSVTSTGTGVFTTQETTIKPTLVFTVVTSTTPTGSIDTGEWDPGAIIYIDGKFSGTTPSLITGVPAGTHSITAELDDESTEFKNFNVLADKIVKLPVKTLDTQFSVVVGGVDPSSVCCNQTAYNASVRVNKSFYAYELETYYRWDGGSTSVPYTLYKDDKQFLQGYLKQGPEINITKGCNNFSESEDNIKRKILPGFYTIKVKKQALCLNSSSNKSEGILFFEGYESEPVIPTKTNFLDS